MAGSGLPVNLIVFVVNKHKDTCMCRKMKMLNNSVLLRFESIFIISFYAAVLSLLSYSHSSSRLPVTL